MIPKISISPVLLLLLIISGLAAISCEKEVIIDDPGAKVVFSNDTVIFDTIFTSIGSATRHFKVFNPFDLDLKINSIKLKGGTNSKYRINVDGIPGISFSDIVIKGGDSLFVFVETTIDPLNANSPIIIEDSVVFNTNGNIQDVKLISWGQDVNIIRGEVFKSGTLTAEKPYLIYDYMMVDTGQVLTIEPGTRLHFRRNAGLYIAGTLIAEGTFTNPVSFEGARTETAYRDIPGQWEGIWLNPVSKNNRFVHARVRNAVTGILADTISGADDTKLYLANSRVENMTFAGLFSRNSKIYSYNTIISNSGNYSIFLAHGGDYSFYHCTVANYWKYSTRRTPSVYIDNVTSTDEGNVSKSVRVDFRNSIIHGSLNNETGFISGQFDGTDIVFDHCLVKIPGTIHTTYPGVFTDCFISGEPGFKDPESFNFRLDENSDAIDTGEPETGNIHPVDFDGKSRISDSAPDIGAFERVDEPDDDDDAANNDNL
ncbi:MAG: choice-of-anchor Q domain-containing protein [Bacteroidales bacterium]